MSDGRRVTYRGEALRFAQELVRLDSPSGEEGAVAERVLAEMRMLGYDDVRQDELGNVVGTVRGERPGHCVLFDAHMDVVPATDPDAWTHGPFSGDRAEGRLWGRGAADVKGSLAALVVAVGALAGKLPAGEVVVAATVGEEMIEGLALGHVLAGEAAEDAAVCRAVVCEPTGLDLLVGHKGRTGLVVEAQGRAAHSSRPEEGVNAVYRLMDAVRAVRSLPTHEDPALGGGVNELVEIVSAPFPGTSMVPYAARARFDRRLVRGETRDGVLAEMQDAVAGIEGVTVRYHRGRLRTYTGQAFDVEDFQPAWAQEPDAPLVQAALRALRGVGQRPAVSTAPYCTNAALSAGALGLPTVLYGAGGVADAHVVDESVALDDLASAYEGYRALAIELTEKKS